ncbi:hypothetical protein BD780_004192 [Clostridium tetanomorphum]|uniref:Uncharacterized protein n=2 Tax=Clostridium tetanomorphum TaxID=1553 RepID=A0A923EE77_CLOTT|nr:hypothetical protein [Clostridium tetanomorphum]KAJ50085.1 hypothetical protein CTM_19619 [Clostridium tetanomorphum DSM 665]MBC2399245.1 hypothetical protein [Clostridium tetanomorphum]MBP1862830.1 hypothetical protein [Clostridium tetanomorphum]NRS86967.1 hypothetical protein [Clostridium tetanomorphum]NRZ99249.1 hypothetical protein [Clostridium tetanomorphum]
MKRHFRILITNFKSMFTYSKILFIFIIFIFSGFLKLSSFGSRDYINIFFYGPNNLFDNILELMIWSLYQFYLIYIIGDYFYKELKVRNSYIISRIGSKMEWHLYIQITIIVACIFYFTTGSIVVGCICFVTRHTPIFSIYEVLKIILILSLSSYFISNIYISIVLISKNHNFSFLIIIILLYLSIELGNIYRIDAFIPFNQGILSKHSFSNFNLSWSFVYLLVIDIINILLNGRLISKFDLMNILD